MTLLGLMTTRRPSNGHPGCQLVAEGPLTGPRGQYVNSYSPEQQRQRVRQLRERASDLRREALELMWTAREIEQQLPTGGDSQDT